ncbi:hypothetical protein E2320_016576 [Naja naja]|nr:hypothetical protein E2320_016576 [Naja naja]
MLLFLDLDLLPPGVCNLLNPSTIYANNEISLNTIGVYGFDYDYTLALYSPALHSRIYNTARDILVEQYKYPKGILKYEYWPNFAVRGLHYDIAKGPAVKQFMDIFSLPEMTLLAVANDFFISNDIDYDPIHLYKDVTLLAAPHWTIDKGMRYMVGKDWRDFFDVVIVQADKPHFFNDCVKPFRRLDSNGDLQWDKINKLEKGQVYKQDLMLRHGWRTGAIVPELETETKMVNTEQYSQALTWLQALTGLLERMQMFQDSESQQVLQDWMKERQELRALTKNLFNPQFGSIFRTCHNPTYFSRRLCRFSDVYMASLSCLLNYDLNYTFTETYSLAA